MRKLRGLILGALAALGSASAHAQALKLQAGQDWPPSEGLAAGAAAGLGGAGCERLYIGSQQQGGAPSLFSARFERSDGSFGPAVAVAAIERPTWLAIDRARPVLYAVSETGNDGASHGTVASFRIAQDSGALSEIGKVDSGGGGPTHLALDIPSNTLMVANYGSGHVATLGIGADGALAGPVSVVRDEGSGPSARQRGPHPHGIAIDPSRRFALVTDLGADRIFIYRFDAAMRALTPAATPFLQLPPGSGPRHLVFSPDGGNAYMLAELTGDLYVYAWHAASATLQPLQTLSILSPAYTGKISAGEIIVSPGGRQVYVSNRGDSTIVAYQVEQGGGRLTELQRLPSAGTQPWNIVLSPDGRWLLVANQASNALASFRVGGDGRLTATGKQLDVAKPVGIVFAGVCARSGNPPAQLANGAPGTADAIPDIPFSKLRIP